MASVDDAQDDKTKRRRKHGQHRRSPQDCEAKDGPRQGQGVERSIGKKKPRGRSAWMLFRETRSRSRRQGEETLTCSAMWNIAAAEWRRMSPEEKAPFKAGATWDEKQQSIETRNAALRETGGGIARFFTRCPRDENRTPNEVFRQTRGGIRRYCVQSGAAPSAPHPNSDSPASLPERMPKSPKSPVAVPPRAEASSPEIGPTQMWGPRDSPSSPSSPDVSPTQMCGGQDIPLPVPPLSGCGQMTDGSPMMLSPARRRCGECMVASPSLPPASAPARAVDISPTLSLHAEEHSPELCRNQERDVPVRRSCVRTSTI